MGVIVHRAKEPKRGNDGRLSRRLWGDPPRHVLVERLRLQDLDDLEPFDGSTLPMPVTTGACHMIGSTVSPPARGTRPSVARPVHSTVLDGLGATCRHWGDPALVRV
jgi:hypothetical protein